MTKSIQWKNSSIILICFLIAVYGKRNVVHFFDIQIDQVELRIIHHYIWWVIPVWVTTIYLFGKDQALKELGLISSMSKGFLFAFIFTIPMLIGYALFGTYNSNETLLSFFRMGFLPGFMEEILFRGFLFGLLFRRFGWGFIPAGIIGGIIFGLQHLYQGEAFQEVLGIFVVTFAGALWFAWLYIEWENNLWLVIFLHTLMNTYWHIFDISESGALGGQEANIFRILTITISVIATIRYAKRRGYFHINRNTIL